MSPPVKARLACDSCKTSKRKCDKHLPSCSLCSRKGLDCNYPAPPTHRARRNGASTSPDSTLQSLPASVAAPSNSTTIEPQLSQQSSPFLAFFYLDWPVFQQSNIVIPKLHLPIPSKVGKLIGTPSNWEPIVGEYFATAHTWMPMISKKGFYNHISSLSSQLHSDYVLLILCMDLITWVPEDQSPLTSKYLAAKSYYLELEIGGVISLQVLQAGILITLFEFGHAIYPSATISLDACIRYGQALGLDWNATSSRQPFSWIELEEENRVWWAIAMMDRISRIGYPGRPSHIEDPTTDVFLPSDDAAWDEGVMPQKRLAVLFSHSFDDLGRFALAAEATRLLGKVLRHTSGTTTVNQQDHIDEAVLLDRALRALINVVHFEGEYRMTDVMNQTLMCSITLILLHDFHITKKTSLADHFKTVHHTQDTTSDIMKSRVEASKNPTVDPFHSCVKGASPFMTTLLYQSACANLRINYENTTKETRDALEVMKLALNDFDLRWRASGTYLKILEARELSYMR